MNSLKTVWLFEIKRLLSNRAFLFLAVAWPLVYAVFFGRVYSGHVVQKMPIAIVDMDRTNLSRTLTRFAGTMRSFEVVATYEHPEQLKDDFLKGDYAAALMIPRNFQRDIKRGRRTQVTAWINATNVVVANLSSSELSYLVATVGGGVQLKFLQKTGSSSERAMEAIQPMPLEMARLYNPGLNYLSYLTPGIWAAIMHQVLILLGVLCFVPHFQRKEVEDLKAKVPRSTAWFWGKWSFYILLGIVIFETFFRGLFPLFGIEIQSSVASLLVFSGLLCASAVSLGTLISLASDRVIGSLKGVLLLASPAFILSGYTFPLSQMPSIYTWISAIFPLTPFVSGYRKLYQEGLSLSFLAPQVIHLVILTLLYAGTSYVLYRKRWGVSR